MAKRLALTAIVVSVFLIFSSSAQALEKLQVGAAFKGSPRYDLLSLAAEEKGFWKEQGLDVEWVAFRGDILMFQATAANKLNMGVGPVSTFLQAAAQGLPITIVADLKSAEYFSIWVKADGPLREPKDIKGAKIGISRLGSATHVMGSLMVRRLGLEKDIKFIGLGGHQERVAALKSGSIDAFVQTVPPVANLVAAGEVRQLAGTKEYLPQDWADYILYSRNNFIEERPTAARGVVRALLKAGDFIVKNPGWTEGKLKKDFGFSEQGVKLAVESLGFTGEGAVNVKGLEAALSFFVEYGLIPRDKTPAVEGLYTSKFLPEGKR